TTSVGCSPIAALTAAASPRSGKGTVAVGAAQDAAWPKATGRASASNRPTQRRGLGTLSMRPWYVRSAGLSVPSAGRSSPSALHRLHLQERAHDRGVEVALGLLLDVTLGLLRLPRLAVGPLASERVVHVHHREDPRLHGDLLPLETVGVTGAVPLLVMVERYHQRRAEEIDGAEQLG